MVGGEFAEESPGGNESGEVVYGGKAGYKEGRSGDPKVGKESTKTGEVQRTLYALLISNS